jgi:DNA-binding transcriptional ArsR family regulator
MDRTRFDLLLHPVRMQIIQTLTTARQMTAGELAARMPDVPPATLDQHLAILGAADVVEVVGARGGGEGAERVYALQRHHLSVTSEDIAGSGPADHMRYFTTFVAGLLERFAHYLKQPNIDIPRDGARYRQVTLNLTPEELTALIDDLGARMSQEMDNEPTPERSVYTISRIVIPEGPAPRRNALS